MFSSLPYSLCLFFIPLSSSSRDANLLAGKQYAQIPASTKVLKILLDEYRQGQMKMEANHTRYVRANAPLEERIEQDWVDEEEDEDGFDLGVDLGVDLGADVDWEQFGEDGEGIDENDWTMDAADVARSFAAAGLCDIEVTSSLRTKPEVERAILTYSLKRFLQMQLQERAAPMCTGAMHLNEAEKSCLQSLYVAEDLH